MPGPTTKPHGKNLFASRMAKTPKSFIREILKVTDDPRIISFAGGLPTRISSMQPASRQLPDVSLQPTAGRHSSIPPRRATCPSGPGLQNGTGNGSG